jgi:hypothetical protein
MAAALCSAGPAVAGLIVFQRQVGGSTHVFRRRRAQPAQGHDGPRKKLAVDTYQAKVSSGAAAHLLRFTVKR